jgi:hypothetical protein
VYPQLFALLDEGIENLQKESVFEAGTDDLFYGGDTELWVKFANSVKLKLYNQIREVQDVVDTGRELIE